jgi:hypothetical protein
MSLGFAPYGSIPIGGQVVDPTSQSVAVSQITESESLFSVDFSPSTTSVTAPFVSEQETLFDLSAVNGEFVATGQLNEHESLFSVAAVLSFRPGKIVYATLSIARHISF